MQIFCIRFTALRSHLRSLVCRMSSYWRWLGPLIGVFGVFVTYVFIWSIVTTVVRFLQKRRKAQRDQLSSRRKSSSISSALPGLLSSYQAKQLSIRQEKEEEKKADLQVFDPLWNVGHSAAVLEVERKLFTKEVEDDLLDMCEMLRIPPIQRPWFAQLPSKRPPDADVARSVLPSPLRRALSEYRLVKMDKKEKRPRTKSACELTESKAVKTPIPIVSQVHTPPLHSTKNPLSPGGSRLLVEDPGVDISIKAPKPLVDLEPLPSQMSVQAYAIP